VKNSFGGVDPSVLIQAAGRPPPPPYPAPSELEQVSRMAGGLLAAVCVWLAAVVCAEVSQEVLSSLPSAAENDGMFTSSADLEVRTYFHLFK
jgi:hypothetical protein